MKTGSKTTKLISSILVILILLPTVFLSKPKQAGAAWWSTWLTDIATASTAVGTGADVTTNTISTGVALKNFAKEIGRQVLMHIASRALQEITKSTVNWINSGYWGSPLFLENPDSFFQDIVKYEVKTIVDAFGYDPRRFPFGRDFALNTINAYKSQLDANMEYSLSKVITDPVLLKSYQTDFNVGGWNGFLINTQYPQNNYLGFQMLATEQLAQKLAGKIDNNIQKVQKTLDLGQGFLSPQTCPSNPNYNTVGNQFKKPTFDYAAYSKDHPYDFEAAANDPTYSKKYMDELNGAEIGWKAKNTCPGGLIATTPGSVVANKIMTAMNAGQHQTELAAAMGNSISAILDAFLNKFLDKGLNALASKVNPSAPVDEWSYEGQTLGSAPGGVNVAWDVGADEPIVLSKFKGDVDEGIKNTQKETQLTDSTMNLFGQIWPKARELDICLPGPDLGWEARADKEMSRNSGKLSEKTSDENQDRAAQAQLALNELQYAVNFFKDWINNKMMLELPNSILFMDAVSEIKTLSQQAEEITKNKRTKSQALARLQSIKTALAQINTQPEIGSGQERILISLYKQYKATQNAIANSVTVADAENEFNIAKEKLAGLKKLVTECNAERKASGWNTPGGWNSNFSGRTTNSLLDNSLVKKDLGVGTFPDVVFYKDRIWVAVQKASKKLMLYSFAKDLTDEKSQQITYNGDQAFPRMTVYNDILWLAFRDDSPSGVKLWRSDTGKIEDLGGGLGNDPVAIQNGYIAWQKLQPDGKTWKVVRRAIDGGETTVIRNSLPTGISRILEDGTVVMIDEDRSVIPGYTKPWFAGNLTVAENPDGGVVEFFNENNVVSSILWPGKITFTPHAAFDGNDLYAITTWGSGAEASARVAVVKETKNTQLPLSPPGTEKALFCDQPIKGGFSHESFVQKGAVTHPLVPLVNAKDVMNWPRFFGLFGTKRVNIEMSCNIIWKANTLDYKGNIPGLTTVYETYEEMPPDTGELESGECVGEGKYAGDLKSAMDAVAAENPALANLPNTESSDGKKENARTFLIAVATKLQSSGFNATAEVKNGNGNPSTGDIIALWKNGDTKMERYDAIAGDPTKTVGQSTQTGFAGLIPLDCTASGGNTDCACETAPETPPAPTGCKTTHPPLTPIDDISLAKYVKASFRGIYGRDPYPGETGNGDVNYWVGKANVYEEFSDNVCRIGWNAYWEDRMRPENTAGSSDPKLGDQLPKYLPS